MSDKKLNSTWRLLPFLDAPGEIQMAVDRWLIKQTQIGEYSSCLRFYSWSPAAISIGYHQKDYPQFWRQLPVDIVRRPTGGKAVFHQGDLTYAVATSSVPGKRWEVYKYICQFLINGWQSLGVKLDYGSSTQKYANHHNCFATSTGADLVTENGIKAIGSAQLRRRNFILQHGSMTLENNSELFIKIFNESAPQNLRTFIPSSDNGTIPKILEALTEAAKDWFKINLVLLHYP